MDGNQADRFLRCQRAEPFLDLAGSEAEAARAHEIDADEIAILGAVAVGLGDVQFAAGLLLVDRNQPSAAAGQGAEDPEHAGFGMVDDLDDPPAIDGAFALVRFLDAQQRAVADTGRRARLRTARNMDADFRRFAAFLIPFGRRCDQFAVAVAAGDVGHDGRRQCGGLVDFFALLGDRPVVGEFAQDAFQLDALGVLEAELRARSRGCRLFPDARG